MVFARASTAVESTRGMVLAYGDGVGRPRRKGDGANNGRETLALASTSGVHDEKEAAAATMGRRQRRRRRRRWTGGSGDELAGVGVDVRRPRREGGGGGDDGREAAAATATTMGREAAATSSSSTKGEGGGKWKRCKAVLSSQDSPSHVPQRCGE